MLQSTCRRSSQDAELSYRQLALFEPADAPFEGVTSSHILSKERQAVIDHECAILGCTLNDIDAYNSRPNKAKGRGASVTFQNEVCDSSCAQY